jgi:NADH-quinone oxidoreductase subunit J
LIAFWILAVLLIATAVFVITQRRPVYSVVGLLANFACLSIMYLTLNAEFLALIQIIVYSGAILILFLFVIALLSSGVRPFTVGPDRLPRVLGPIALFGIIALGALLFVIAENPGAVVGVASTGSVAGAVGAPNVFGSVADFGKALFTTYLLPFEATAFVLMIAVIGVIALAGDVDPPRPRPKRRTTTEREPIYKKEGA